VVAEEVVVRGRIIGPIHAIHVHIYAGAHVEGDISHETISIENGAYMHGSVRRMEDPVEIRSQAMEETDLYLEQPKDLDAAASAPKRESFSANLTSSFDTGNKTQSFETVNKTPSFEPITKTPSYEQLSKPDLAGDRPLPPGLASSTEGSQS